MSEFLQSLEGIFDMPVDENTSRELRGKIERAIDQYHDLNMTVTRIETRFVAAETHLIEKISEVTTALRGLTIFAQEMQEIRMIQQRTTEEQNKFEREKNDLKVSISKVEQKLQRYDFIIKILSTFVAFLAAAAIPVIASTIKFLFKLP